MSVPPLELLRHSTHAQHARSIAAGEEPRARASELDKVASALINDLAQKGLLRKDYLNGEVGTGGVYLWESRDAAEAWFTEERLGMLTERFGAPPTLTWSLVAP